MLAVPAVLLVGRGPTLSTHQPAAAAPAAQPSLTPADQARIERTLKRNAATIRWVANRGQLPKSVLYSFSTPDSRVLVERDRLRFEFVRPLEEHAREGAEGREPEVEEYRSHSFVVHFDGASTNVRASHGAAFSTLYNYFSGSDRSGWATAVPAFKEVTLRDLYPGISLRLYSRADSPA